MKNRQSRCRVPKNYQNVLDESPEAFSAFSAEFRERYLRATLSHRKT
jgi:hypothetical protein